MVHLSRVFGMAASTVAVTITGTGSDSTFVTIGGVSYKSAASTTVAIGDVIYMEVGASYSSATPKIGVDGSTVAIGTTLAAATYNMTVVEGVSNITIALGGSDYLILVTTS